MSQSQGIEVRRPSRRTIATGAAWAVPVIAVGAAAPLAAASPTCVPEFTVVPEESFKCCNTAIKNMKLVVEVTDVSQCLDVDAVVCIQSVTPSTPNVTIGQTVFEPLGDRCTTEGGTFTVYLLNVSNCTVNLTITFSVDGGAAQTAQLKSGNIPNGNTIGDCIPGDLVP
jgi:hypothetical protein